VLDPRSPEAAVFEPGQAPAAEVLLEFGVGLARLLVRRRAAGRAALPALGPAVPLGLGLAVGVAGVARFELRVDPFSVGLFLTVACAQLAEGA